MMDENLKRDILIDHYQNPRNKKLSNDLKYISIHNRSTSCIDDFTVQVLQEDEIIKDVRFDGRGCAISTSSISIISELIIGKSKDEALNILDNYLNMLNLKDYNQDILEEANAFDTIYKQPNRIKCALIAIEPIIKIIKESYGKK